MKSNGNELEELQGKVLIGIGRNVLNLQKMEGMLKFIVSSTGRISSTTDLSQPLSELKQSLKNRKKAISRLPMGRLVKILQKTVDPKKNRQTEDANSQSITGLNVSFSIDDEAFVEQLLLSLGEVVSERNELIHKKLMLFNLASKESCQKLITELDEQRARIKPLLEALTGLCSNLRDFYKYLKDYADSEQNDDDLNRAQKQHIDSSSD